MIEPRRDTNWWGWGDPMRRTELDATALGVLRERIGDLEPWPLAARIEDFELPDARPLPGAVIDAVGAAAVFDGKEDRLRHAVGSGYVDLARLRSVVEKEKITLPVLIDHDNVLADDFQAKTNAQAFLIDANHILRYHGGIDDDPRGDRRKQGIEVQERLGLALQTVLNGAPPEYNWTIPSGRPLKRAPKAAGEKER